MPGKHISDDEKARILAWRQEKFPVKTICEGSGRTKIIVMKLKADAKDLSSTEVPKHKFGEEKRHRVILTPL